MEKDDEVKGGGNSYTTEFRQYDARVGRWLSLDPLMAKFPWQSPYVAFDNNPIYFVDPLGSESEGNGDKGWEKGDKGSRKKDNGDGTVTYDAPVGNIVLPERAKIISTLQDGNCNKKVDYNGKPLEGQFGDVYKFSIDGIEYVVKYEERAFKGYTNSSGTFYNSPLLNKRELELELDIQAASAGISFGALGAEIDAISWNYFSIQSSKGWDEGNKSLTMHDFSFLNTAGVGTSPNLAPKESIEILSNGGGALTIQSKYLKKHPTTSLIQLLYNKNIITVYAGCGNKYLYFDIFDDELNLIAKGSVHSFSLSLPGGGIRQGKTNFK